MPPATSMESRRRNFNTGQFDEELGRTPLQPGATLAPPPTAAVLNPNWRPQPPQATPPKPQPPSYQATPQSTFGAAQAAPAAAPPPPPYAERLLGTDATPVGRSITPGATIWGPGDAAEPLPSWAQPADVPPPMTEPGVPGGGAEVPGAGTDVPGTGEELPSWWEDYFDLARGGSEAYLNRQQELAERELMEDLARRGALGGSAEAGARRELATDIEAQRAQQEFEFFDRALQFDRQWRELDMRERSAITSQLISMLPFLGDMSEEDRDALIPELLAQMGVSPLEV